jgi:hypothetical protein
MGHLGVVAMEELVTLRNGLDPQVMRDRGAHPRRETETD